MEVQHYEVSIVVMDNQCNNSVSYIDICSCRTKAEAQKATKKAIRDLQAGRYNSCLKGVNYVYVNVIPYSEDDCLLGLAWDYASKFFAWSGKKWV